MEIKNALMSLFMVLILCLSSMPVLATEVTKAMPPFTIAVGDTAPASDVIISVNVLTALRDSGYDTSAVGTTKLFSEVNGLMLDGKVTLAIYKGAAVIIVGATSPASHAMFAVDLTNILRQKGVSSRTILSSEVPSANLIDLFEERAGSEAVIEHNFGVLTYISTRTSNICDFVSGTGCTLYTAEYKYMDKSARIVAGVEVHPTQFTNQQAIDGIMGEFGRSGYTSVKETLDGNNIYLFTGGQYPDQQMLAAWYSGKNVVALYVDNSPAVLNDAQVDDVFEDSLVKYYLAKYPSDLVFGVEEVPVQQCRDSDGGMDYYNKGTIYGLWAYNNQPSAKEGEKDYCAWLDKSNEVSSCEGNSCMLVEFYCTSSTHFGNTPYTCPYGCSNGACNPAPGTGQTRCTDSDNGKNYYVKGLVTTSDESMWDYCKDSRTVVELTCDEAGGKAYTYTCQYGCSNGACLSQPVEEQEFLQKIVAVDGNKGSYAPKEPISLTVKGIEIADGSPASSDEGWNVQYYTYKTKDPYNYLQEYVPTGNYNGVFSDKYWQVDYWAPKEEGSYYTEVILYCSRQGSECWEQYAGHGLEWREKIYFTVKGTTYEQEEGNPDLVITNVEHKGVTRETGGFEAPYIRFAITVKNIGGGTADLSPEGLGTSGIWGKMNGKDIGWIQFVDRENTARYLDAGDSRTYYWDYADYYSQSNLKGENELVLYADRVYTDEALHYLPKGKISESNEDNNKFSYRFELSPCRDTEIGYTADVDGKITIYGVSVADSYDNEKKMAREYWCASDYVAGYGYRYKGAVGEIEIVEEEEIVPPREVSVAGQVPTKADCDGAGCAVDSTCVSLGIRLLKDNEPVYCDFDGALKVQKDDGNACQNNYECLSNTCGNGKCQDFEKRLASLEQEMKETKGILNRLLSWIKGWFGGGDGDDDGGAVTGGAVADSSDSDGNAGHGNDDDRVDKDNPGNSSGSNAGGNGNGGNSNNPKP